MAKQLPFTQKQLEAMYKKAGEAQLKREKNQPTIANKEKEVVSYQVVRYEEGPQYGMYCLYEIHNGEKTQLFEGVDLPTITRQLGALLHDRVYGNRR